MKLNDKRGLNNELNKQIIKNKREGGVSAEFKKQKKLHQKKRPNSYNSYMSVRENAHWLKNKQSLTDYQNQK